MPFSSLPVFREVVDEPLGLLPAEAGVGNGLAVDAVSDGLCAVDQVALDHEALDEVADRAVVVGAVDDVLGNADLFIVLLAGVAVVGVHEDGGVLCPGLFVEPSDGQQVFVVVVRVAVAELVHAAAHNGVGMGVALRGHFPAAVQEGVACLGGDNGVHHDGEVAAGGVLETAGYTDAAGDDSVLLVFHRTGADCHVGQKVGQVAVVFRVEHLIGAGEVGLVGDALVHAADGDDAGEHVLPLLRVRLVEHALVADTDGAGFVRIHSGDDEDGVFDLLIDLGQPVHVVHDGVFPVGRAGADDQEQLFAAAFKDVDEFVISLLFDLPDAVADGELALELLRTRQFPGEIHLHFQGNALLSFAYFVLFFPFWSRSRMM